MLYFLERIATGGLSALKQHFLNGYTSVRIGQLESVTLSRDRVLFLQAWRKSISESCPSCHFPNRCLSWNLWVLVLHQRLTDLKTTVKVGMGSFKKSLIYREKEWLQSCQSASHLCGPTSVYIPGSAVRAEIMAVINSCPFPCNRSVASSNDFLTKQ